MPNSLAIASQKLITGIRGKFIGDPYIAEAAVIVPSQFRNGSGSPNWFFGPNGIDYKFIYEGAMSASKAYVNCPPLAAVINRKAQAYINGQTKILNTVGKDAAGDKVKRIKNLLANPNPLQSWKQFEALMYIYQQLFGFCILMPIYPAGFNILGDGSQAKSLWLIPPDRISVKESDKLWYNTTSVSDAIQTVTLKYKDVNIDLPTKDLFIFRDFTPNFQSMIFPGSKVRSLAMPINNIMAALEARNELINYAGSQGILTPDTDSVGAIPLKYAEKEQLQADFKRQYGIKKGQFRYIISPAAMKWQQMGKPTKDLMLFEEIADDIMRICDAFGYPSPLLNSEKGPSVSNTKEYKAQVYQDAIIPESMDMYEQWNVFFKTADDPFTISKDYDHIPVLKSDQVDDGRAQLYRNQAYQLAYQNDVITMNAWREAMGYEKTPDGDVFFSQSQQAQDKREANQAAIANMNNSSNQNNDDETQENQ